MECKKYAFLILFLILFSKNPLLSQGGTLDSNKNTAPHNHEEHKGHGDSKDGKQHTDHLMESPAGLMGTHIHEPGKIMVEYRYMLMDMQGLYRGSDKINGALPMLLPHATSANGGTPVGEPGKGSSTYMMVPERMNMEMHMASFMTTIGENFSVMLMIPFVRNTMEMMSQGTYLKSYMSSSGVGDIQGQFSYRFLQRENHTLLLNFGMSFPTGSVDQSDSMGLSMGMARSRVPYNMQPGTGTYNPSPGLTYAGNSGNYFWGSQVLATLRNGKNDNGYRFGNRYDASFWFGYKILDWASLLGRIQYQKWDNIVGSDPVLDQKMDPQNDPNLQGGRRGLAFVGLNLRLPFLFSETRIQAEYGVPFYQHLNGPQLGTKSVVNLTAQMVF